MQSTTTTTTTTSSSSFPAPILTTATTMTTTISTPPRPFELQTPTNHAFNSAQNDLPMLKINSGIAKPPPELINHYPQLSREDRAEFLKLLHRYEKWLQFVEHSLFPQAGPYIRHPSQLDQTESLRGNNKQFLNETVTMKDGKNQLVPMQAISFGGTLAVLLRSVPTLCGNLIYALGVKPENNIFVQNDKRYVIKESSFRLAMSGTINPQRLALVKDKSKLGKEPPHIKEDPSRELRVLHFLQTKLDTRHPNIIRYLYYGYTADFLYIVFERGVADAHSWFAASEMVNNISRLCFHLQELLKQMASALAFLHGHGIIHRDVSANNVILLRENPITFQLIDFGLAIATNLVDTDSSRWNLSYMDEHNGLNWGVGKQEYLAPEIAIAHGTPIPPNFRYYGPSSDAFAYGCMWFICATQGQAKSRPDFGTTNQFNLLFHPNSRDLTEDLVNQAIIKYLPNELQPWAGTLRGLLHPNQAKRTLICDLVKPGGLFQPPEHDLTVNVRSISAMTTTSSSSSATSPLTTMNIDGGIGDGGMMDIVGNVTTTTTTTSGTIGSNSTILNVQNALMMENQQQQSGLSMFMDVVENDDV
jgi:serine/threonine protein kinase